MSRASREAEAIAANEAYFNRVRAMPEPDWAAEAETAQAPPHIEPTETDTNKAVTDTAELPILGVAVLQLGAPSWTTKHRIAEYEEEQRLEKEQERLTEAYLADPLNLDNEIPESLLWQDPEPIIETDTVVEEFSTTHAAALDYLPKEGRARLRALASMLATTSMRSSALSLPEVGAIPAEPVMGGEEAPEPEAAYTVVQPESEPEIGIDTTASLPEVGAIPTMPQAPNSPLTHAPQVMSLQARGQQRAHQPPVAQQVHVPEAGVPPEPEAAYIEVQQSEAPSQPATPDKGTALVQRIIETAAAVSISNPEPQNAPAYVATNTEAQPLLDGVQEQQQAPAVGLLEQVLSGLRKSVALDHERNRRLHEATFAMDEGTFIENPRAVGAAIFEALGMTMALEEDANGHKTRRVVRNADGGALLAFDLHHDADREMLQLRTNTDVRRFLGRLAGTLGGDIRVTRL